MALSGETSMGLRWGKRLALRRGRVVTLKVRNQVTLEVRNDLDIWPDQMGNITGLRQLLLR
jgi:hypothetical protein